MTSSSVYRSSYSYRRPTESSFRPSTLRNSSYTSPSSAYNRPSTSRTRYDSTPSTTTRLPPISPSSRTSSSFYNGYSSSSYGNSSSSYGNNSSSYGSSSYGTSSYGTSRSYGSNNYSSGYIPRVSLTDRSSRHSVDRFDFDRRSMTRGESVPRNQPMKATASFTTSQENYRYGKTSDNSDDKDLSTDFSQLSTRERPLTLRRSTSTMDLYSHRLGHCTGGLEALNQGDGEAVEWMLKTGMRFKEEGLKERTPGQTSTYSNGCTDSERRLGGREERGEGENGYRGGSRRGSLITVGNDEESLASVRAKRYSSVDRTFGSSSTNNSSAITNGGASEKRSSGLRNLGNTCFMNSILQCLAHTRPFLDYCLKQYSPSDINHSTSKMDGALVTAYVKLLEKMWSGVDAVSPMDFKSEIARFAKRFVGYNQQDAQEFLIYLLEGLHEDLNRVKEKKKSQVISNSNDQDQVETISASDKAKQSWKEYLQYDNSPINDLFVGQLKSALTCRECGYTSNTFDPFLDLSLPIRKGRSDVSLLECFDLFSQEENMDGDEKPTCAKCKKRQPCTKRLSIQKFPRILIIHLKRFSQDYAYRSKLSTDVRCPITNLDLSPFTDEKCAQAPVYDLYAVSNHSGTPSGGHYTAAALDPYSSNSRCWRNFNDHRVTGISENSLISHEAYILFYQLSESSNSSNSSCTTI